MRHGWLTVVRWVSAGLTIAVLCAWILSYIISLEFVHVRDMSHASDFGVEGGALIFIDDVEHFPPSIVGGMVPGTTWGWRWGSWRGYAGSVAPNLLGFRWTTVTTPYVIDTWYIIPFWFVAFCTGVITGLLWRRWRPRMASAFPVLVSGENSGRGS